MRAALHGRELAWMSVPKFVLLRSIGGTRWCSWLRHCATSRKVTGSIPDGVIGIFRL
jgi:hypothetical protein